MTIWTPYFLFTLDLNFKGSNLSDYGQFYKMVIKWLMFISVWRCRTLQPMLRSCNTFTNWTGQDNTNVTTLKAVHNSRWTNTLKLYKIKKTPLFTNNIALNKTDLFMLSNLAWFPEVQRYHNLQLKQLQIMIHLMLCKIKDKFVASHPFINIKKKPSFPRQSLKAVLYLVYIMYWILKCGFFVFRLWFGWV